jgi:hypothetical protein
MVVLNGQYQDHAFDLAGPVTIGRSAECEIVFDLPSVSRQHARIEPKGAEFIARDLGSRNGIKVGGIGVHESALNHGDVLTVGDVQMRFELLKPGAAAPPAATAEVAAAPAARPATAPIGHLKIKLMIAVGIGLVTALLLGFLLLKVMEEPGARVADLRPMIIKVGENKWMRVNGWHQIRVANSRNWNWVWLGEFAELSVENAPGRPRAQAPADTDAALRPDAVVAVQRYDAGELVVTGKSGGDATVVIRLMSGSELRLRVLVRGRVEDPVEELRALDLGQEGLRLRAMQYVAIGKSIQIDRPYLALLEYRKALLVLDKVDDKGAVFLTARTGARDAEAAVAKRWEELRTSVSMAATSNDRARQMQLLEEAMKLIPDPNDPRYQKAHSRLQQLIEEEIKSRQNRSGVR